MPTDSAVPASSPGPRLGLLAYTGVDDLDFFGAWSVLAKAQETRGGADGAAPPRSMVLSVDGDFTTSGGLTVGAPVMERDVTLDALIVPGGAGAAATAARSDIGDRLRAWRRDGTRFYTICSGALLLAGCGLLAGRRVAIHRDKQAMLDDSGCAGVVTGLHTDAWLTSIGGLLSPSVKSVALAFRVLEDFCPAWIAMLQSRMEIVAACD